MSKAVERTLCPTCGRLFAEGERFCPFDRSELQRGSMPTDDPLVGTVIAESYTLLQKLGAGGMGVVYRARQHRLERDVAIKLLSVNPGADAAARDRFRLEALAVSHLSNPHTVSVYDFGSTDAGLPYLVMQLVQGESLKARLGRGRLPLRDAVTIAAQVAESLSEAHDRHPQVIHRDIKPENVFVRTTADGEPFATVLDFGLVHLADAERLTAVGVVIGTPAYMAPEQAVNTERLDARVDLYALGAVLHEMIAGRPPFSAPTNAQLLYSQVWDPPPPLRPLCPDLAIPPELEALVLALLRKKAADRPASAHHVRSALLDIQGQLPRPSRTPYPPATPAVDPAAGSHAPEPPPPQPTTPAHVSPIPAFAAAPLFTTPEAKTEDEVTIPEVSRPPPPSIPEPKKPEPVGVVPVRRARFGRAAAIGVGALLAAGVVGAVVHSVNRPAPAGVAALDLASHAAGNVAPPAPESRPGRTSGPVVGPHAPSPIQPLTSTHESASKTHGQPLARTQSSHRHGSQRDAAEGSETRTPRVDTLAAGHDDVGGPWRETCRAAELVDTKDSQSSCKVRLDQWAACLTAVAQAGAGIPAATATSYSKRRESRRIICQLDRVEERGDCAQAALLARQAHSQGLSEAEHEADEVAKTCH